MVELKINRKPLYFVRNSEKVIAKFFKPGKDDHIRNIINRILSLTEDKCKNILNSVLKDFTGRHRDIVEIFINNFQKITFFLPHNQNYSNSRKLLLGAYFTKEYAIEAAALFNPSIVPHPNQEGLQSNEKRIILSFRATGEKHISSIIFRSGIINSNDDIIMDPVSQFVEMGNVSLGTDGFYNKKLLVTKLAELNIENETVNSTFSSLPNHFQYRQLKEVAQEVEERQPDEMQVNQTIDSIKWVAKCNYQLEFRPDSDISERIIFPVRKEERRGIEDARFVRFVDETSTVTYYATITAYDGRNILPVLLETKDFLRFKMCPLLGDAAKDKDMALFPRKIDGKFAMIGRQDGENMFLVYSDNILFWQNAQKIQTPTYSWEFVKIGNCGSPIETEAGWLLLTHGVGPVRKYTIGVELLDLDDPSKVIGKLKEPLIMPNEIEREGYVPNVVYTCGAMIHNGTLIIPIAFSDIASGIVTVSLKNLLNNLKPV
ncbi:MAG: glycoside hydrolase family 130 protein [Promethearchaeota archaeon]